MRSRAVFFFFLGITLLASLCDVAAKDFDFYYFILMLSNISSELEAHWANIRCPSNNGRSNWQTKWRNYGVCSDLNEKEYFRGLELKAKVDDIKNVINASIDAEPLIKCSKGPFKTLQLFEVYICIAHDGWTIIDCPVKQKFTCNNEILFHPYKSWMLKDTTKAF
ncbi:Ribonuclease 3 [Apostasia shenzhenica]|uniref:Ribonuclease 3 n=1 Tax=Apostasia shenzhenica TaxID=1088818 RepID=A0A2I0B472_9ASPA|nr:Ribonuclease 3 [Apostasia shenzhenica]